MAVRALEAVHIDWVVAAELEQVGRTRPDLLNAPDDDALYKSLVGTPDHVERVLSERSDAARCSLVEASREARGEAP